MHVHAISRDRNIHPVKIDTDVRAIAMYLPQFHSIPENDKWWGHGFTEWINVRRGIPLYKGHHQPHVPHADIGYYDLSDSSALEMQAMLAAEHGIEGFCYYYYWFQGKRLLEKPTEMMLASGKPNFPFCFCWANENWTRTWDGGEHEVLMAQKYSAENNDKIIRDLIPAFKDSRYIRVNDRPLFIVYRPQAIPNFSKVAEDWRTICRAEGIGEIYIAAKKSFADLNPERYAIDAVIQFPPLLNNLENLGSSDNLNVKNGFRGHIHDYRDVAVDFAYASETHKLFYGICPSWDNTARRMERGTSYINSNPENYFLWLKTIVEKTRAKFRKEERFIFINAWNEWAEGCHLEPDEKYGYAWLNATKAALYSQEIQRAQEASKILVIGHDAHLAGAQTVLLSLLKEWGKNNEFEFKILLREGGVLLDEYSELGDLIIYSELKTSASIDSMHAKILRWNPDVILSSTVTNGLLLQELRQKGFQQPVVTYTHELQKSIERWAPGEVMLQTLSCTDFFLCGGKEVAANLIINHAVASDRLEVVNGFIDTWGDVEKPNISKIQTFKEELCIGRNDIVVFGCGTTDWRKGSDLFIEIGRYCVERNNIIKFVWIGGDADANNKVVTSFGLGKKITFLPNTLRSRKYYYTGDIFLLSSREDPFPLVALEAADAGLPIVCFEGTGGMPSFVGEDAGVAVPYEQIRLAAEAVLDLTNNHEKRKLLGEHARKKVRERHTTPIAAKDIAHSINELLGASKVTNDAVPLVSVIVPNYNHSKYLPDRLESIANQTYKNIEIILLDDASTDHSVEILEEFVKNEPRARFIKNVNNSGSTFKQWQKVISEAMGKYIWIAESDDSADPVLLENLVSLLESDPEIVISTCQLQMMDPEGNLGGTPDEWLGELDADRWNHAFVNEGLDEIRDFLSKKNTILNASGVVFRKIPGVESLVDDTMRLCADWLFWVRMLSKGKIAYTPEVLNYWRLQSSNARTKAPGMLEWEEAQKIIAEISNILKLDKKDQLKLLSSFEKKCIEWSNAIK